MKIAQPAAWGELKPTVPEGFSVTAIATGLKIPRQSLVLPNGDILVAEGRGGSAAKLKPKDVIASQIKAKGNTQVKGGNRLTLLRDADGDGNYEVQAVFADNLNAPYGLAYANGKLYVANQDALVRFDYKEGQTQAEGPPTKVTDLPAEINHHWTKALTISRMAASCMWVSARTAISPSAAWRWRSIGPWSGRSMPRPAHTGPMPPACVTRRH